MQEYCIYCDNPTEEECSECGEFICDECLPTHYEVEHDDESY